MDRTDDRVRAHTAPDVLRRIDDATTAELTLCMHAGRDAIEARLHQLEREWDIERALQTNASLIALAGLALGLRADRRFLLVPVAVFGFLAQHAVQGWCPPVPVLRRLGVRTMREIERERYAIKALRGDFDRMPTESGATVGERVHAALGAVDA